MVGLVIQCARDAEGLPDLKLPKPTITILGKTLTSRPVIKTGPLHFVAEWDGHTVALLEVPSLVGGRRYYLADATPGAAAALVALGVSVTRAKDVTAANRDALRTAGVPAVQRRSDGAIVAVLPTHTLGGDPVATAIDGIVAAPTEEYRPVRSAADDARPWV